MKSVEEKFKNIDTIEQAYWLGFIYADGYIKGTMLRFCLGVKDEDQLIRFIQFMDGDVGDIKRYGPYKTSGLQIHYSIHNRELIDNLKSHGLCEKKSLVIRFPNLRSMDIKYSFMLGYFDGDGCQNTTNFCSGSKLFVEDVKEVFDIPFDIVKKNVYYLSLGAELFRKMMSVYENSMDRKRLNPKIEKIEKDPCPVCGGEKSTNASTCNDCYSIKRVEQKIYYSCPLCYKKRNRRSKLCNSCNKLHKKNSINPKKLYIDKELLNKLLNIDNMSLTKIAIMYNVSDNAIKRRAIKMGIYFGRQKNFKGGK